MNSSFTDNQKSLVFQLIRQTNATQLQTAQPSGNFNFPQGKKDFPKLIYCRLIICVRFYTFEAVEFLIIIVLHTAAHSGQQAVTLAHSMLAAATGITRCPVRLHRVIYPATHPHDCRDNARSQYQCQYQC